MKPRYSLLGQEDLELLDSGATKGSSPPPQSPGLDSLADVFSSFSRHLAPGPGHDRPERSVQMRLYTMQKRHFLVAFTTFAALFLVSVLLGAASPDMVERSAVKASSLNMTAGGRLPKGPFLLRSPRLSRFNQQLWLLAELVVEESHATVSQDFTVMASVVGLDRGLTKGDLLGSRHHNRSHRLECSGSSCTPVILLHLGFLPDSMYLVNVSLLGLEPRYASSVKDVVFTWATYNPSFTELEIVFRFLFLVITFAVLGYFLSSLRKYPINDWSMEQRWSSLLLFLLLFYNNPFFPLTLTTACLLGGVTDATFQSIFLFSLLLFWLCALHGLRQTRRPLVTFYLPKFLLVFPMWLAALTMEITQEFNEMADPSYSWQIDTAHYHRFRALFFILLALYIGYTLYLTAKAFVELRSMQFIQTRLKFITTFMGVIIILCLSIVYSKFGSGVLEDNFVARLYTDYASATHFLAFYALLNLYIYLMVYVYGPCGHKEGGSLPLGDAMDSDEEVLFGDTEAGIRKPLNSLDEEESD